MRDILSPAMSINQTLLPEFDREAENTRKILAAIPDGKWDWRPHEKSMSLGVLAGHVADMPDWGHTSMTTDSLTLNPGDYSPFVPGSTADLVARFEEKKSELRKDIEAASDEQFLQVWTMTWGGQKVLEMPRVAVIRGMVLNHMIHHRGQLSVYLRLLGAPVPGVYGPSADEKQPSSSNQ